MKAWKCQEHVSFLGYSELSYGVIFAETYEDADLIAKKECTNGTYTLVEIPIETGYHFIG